MGPRMEPLFLGGHPAVDFLNTAFAPDGQEIETIGDGRTYLDWFVSAGLLTEAEAARVRRRFGAQALDHAAAEARKVREWARNWLARSRAAPRADYAEELGALNRLLAREARRLEVVESGKGLNLVDQLRIDSAETLLGLVAAQIAALITKEDLSLVKTCAGPGCTLWFLDRTKAHRRLFCSAATCGNRAKVAAFRKRKR
jgi:predicted RNA-binding Zn ribbon-like protein